MLSLNGKVPSVPVAVDAMGGDHAPREIILGAIEAARQGIHVILVGDERAVQQCLAEFDADLPVVHAAECIGMDESVAQALHREDSSLFRAALLVESGQAGAVVSAGNSAAIMALSLHVFGALPGIDRPAFGGFVPTRGGACFLLDIGANMRVKATNLVQFAVMGDVYVRLSTGNEFPRIGLVSNASEDTKGPKEVKQANEALRKLDLNFVGNIEGNGVFEGVADIAVCDGLSGNILLKGAEGVAMEIFNLLKAELSRDLVSKVAAAAMMPAFRRIRNRVDYQETGGVPVLGVSQVMINCHGRSQARAVTNAILLAARLARDELPQRIGEALQADDVEVNRRRRLARAFHLGHSPA